MKKTKLQIIIVTISLIIIAASAFFILTGKKEYSQEEKEAYLAQNISYLASQNGMEEVLGGHFFIDSIVWEDENTAIIEFEDGHNLFKARAVFDELEVESFDGLDF